MLPPSQNAALIAVAIFRAAAERQIYERHAGSGPRGSHQLGKTPIRLLPPCIDRHSPQIRFRAFPMKWGSHRQFGRRTSRVFVREVGNCMQHKA
jgi:hypothetical protein